MDCEQFRSALVDGRPGLEDHARACASCAALLVATAPAREGPPSSRALRVLPDAPSGRARAALALAAVVAFGVLGARALSAPPAPATVAPPAPAPVASALPAPSVDALADPFADPSEDDLGDDTLSVPTDLLSSAVLNRSPR